VISAQFGVEICIAARSREKFTKTRYFGGSRSFKVTDARTPGKLVSSGQQVCLSAIFLMLDELKAAK